VKEFALYTIRASVDAVEMEGKDYLGR